MNKVIEISLIENVEKKKRAKDTDILLADYKKKIINDLEDVISLKFFKNKNIMEVKKSHIFLEIRNSFVTFYNSYIELNSLFVKKNNENNIENNIIKEIIDEMVSNVIYRVENLDINSIKEVYLLKELIEKDKDRITIDMEN